MEAAYVYGILAATSFLPPLAFMLWARAHERHNREPVLPVLGIFGHGATLGIAVAIILSIFLDLSITAPGTGSLFFAAVIIAPIVEEFAKGLGFGFVRRNMDELEDGLVYGVSVGLGFAATETFLYGLAELDASSLTGAVGVVVARNISSMLLHAGSSALLGFGYARMRTRGGAFASLAPYYLVAVLLHAAYNLLVLSNTWLGFLLAIVLVVSLMIGLLRQVKRLDRQPRPMAWMPVGTQPGPDSLRPRP